MDNLRNISPHFDLQTLIPFMIDRWLMIGQANAGNFYSSEQFSIYQRAIWTDLVDKLVRVSCSHKSICLSPDKKWISIWFIGSFLIYRRIPLIYRCFRLCQVFFWSVWLEIECLCVKRWIEGEKRTSNQNCICKGKNTWNRGWEVFPIWSCFSDTWND